MSPRAPFLIGGSLLFGSCAGEDARRPDVVVIVVDTLRADRLPFGGGPAGAAPFLGELAERSLVFENAWSPSSWTLPAAVSVLTSVHPFQHGVTSLEGLELEEGQEPVPVRCIPTELETLPETMRAAGYRTFGIVSNVLVGFEVDFDRGFDRYVRLEDEDEDADAVHALVESWRDELLSDEPVFLYVHYIDPHDPFHGREPWFDPERAHDSGWPTGFPERTDDTHADLAWILKGLEPRPPWLGERRVSELSDEEVQDLLAWMRAEYDSEIGFVDTRIRALFERLRLDEAIVFFLADHGEEFYEHGDLTHGQNLYAETVRVPLLLRLPGPDAPRGRVRANVSTLDVLPTLRGLLDLPPSDQDQGKDLLTPSADRPVLGFLEGDSGQHELEGDLVSLVRGRYRLIARGENALELYDLESDPGERDDLAVRLPEIARDLFEELQALRGAAPAYRRVSRIPGPPSEALQQHLRGIGYAGNDE